MVRLRICMRGVHLKIMGNFRFLILKVLVSLVCFSIVLLIFKVKVYKIKQTGRVEQSACGPWVEHCLAYFRG